jgi:hypothetical protein
VSDLWLAIIAISVALMATVQVAVLVAAARLARRVDQMAGQMEQEIKPLLANLTAVTAEAARTASLAASQVERVDRLFSDLSHRADQTLAIATTLVGGPAREGMAVVAGVRAAFSALRGLREAARRRRASVRPLVEDEESLFIG